MIPLDRIPPGAGRLSIELRDPRGRIVRRMVTHNAYTDLAATEHAKALAGEATDLAISHIGLGAAGWTIEQCDSATGWSGTPTVDSGVYREGTEALTRTVTASNTAHCYHEDAIAAYDASTDTDIEVWLRLALRGRFTLAGSYVRIYSGGSASAYFQASFAAIETAMGVPFADATWRLCRIPKASFTTGAGSPSWATVTGAGVYIAANATGSAILHWDDFRTFVAPNLTQTATSLPNLRSLKAVTLVTRGGRIVTLRAYWGPSEIVGQVYVAGAYCNAGSTLMAIAPAEKTDPTGTVGFYKGPGLTAWATWSRYTTGG
jgi:hypothetical protein